MISAKHARAWSLVSLSTMHIVGAKNIYFYNFNVIDSKQFHSSVKAGSRLKLISTSKHEN